jgi:hypothetical protein
LFERVHLSISPAGANKCAKFMMARDVWTRIVVDQRSVVSDCRSAHKPRRRQTRGGADVLFLFVPGGLDIARLQEMGQLTKLRSLDLSHISMPVRMPDQFGMGAACKSIVFPPGIGTVGARAFSGVRAERVDLSRSERIRIEGGAFEGRPQLRLRLADSATVLPGAFAGRALYDLRIGHVRCTKRAVRGFRQAEALRVLREAAGLRRPVASEAGSFDGVAVVPLAPP